MMPSRTATVSCSDHATAAGDTRASVSGKFIFVGSEKLYVRGVTYGTFRPDADGQEFPAPRVVGRDFARMAASGVNAVRTYTVPPTWLLDTAWQHGLRLLVGLPVERSVGFLADERTGLARLERLVRNGVEACRDHPAVLCYALGNEIPAPVVRWHGRRRMERCLERLYRVAKAEDPLRLVTYVNYPTTEYLHLPFLDLVCFNTYLESKDRLEAYLARLHNLAGDRPLVMSEIGLDSLRNGEDEQARVVEWQVRTAFASGCAGVFVYGWTDEWHRGGADVDDWAFGLTRRDRQPKRSLKAVGQAFAEVPFSRSGAWPRISVVVCTYNGRAVVSGCLAALQRLEYPNFEVIVVDDGSTDGTAQVASEYGYRVISLIRNRGLSTARNVGMEAATGEIVAYIDDDAYPDAHWLRYLAITFLTTTHAAVGGPNVAPDGDGLVADSVACAPGNPAHVLISDQEAEHIPGCNMAVLRERLVAVGGFDPAFRVAGDDVDLCWRLRQRGWTLGFNPAAMVWHRRRPSVRAFWRQQVGYGRSEALLERKWPENYNVAGHASWSGRLYGKGIACRLGRPARIYYGTWGTAPFQRLCDQPSSSFLSLPLMPEWYLVILAFAGLSGLGVLWGPLLIAAPLLGVAVAVPLVQAGVSAARASFPDPTRRGRGEMFRLRVLTALLHLLQPLARLRGRLGGGLTPWRRLRMRRLVAPRTCTRKVWSEHWKAPEERLRSLEKALRASQAVVLRGGEYERWDLEVRAGMFGATRLLMAVEEHGWGRQLIRLRTWPRCSALGLGLTCILVTLFAGAAFDGVWTAAGVLAIAGGAAVLLTLEECAASSAAMLQALADFGSETGP
jgi:GT2 family glycosyltransferase